MRKHFLAAVALCGLFGASVAAAMERPALAVDIPFNFQVGNQTMPAGTYVVRQNLQSGVIGLLEQGGTASVMALTNNVQATKIPDKGRLVFRRHGNDYFLAQIWTGGSDAGRAIGLSKAEREMAKAPQTGYTQLALVTIDAR